MGCARRPDHSVSPGIISTPMGQQEMDGPSGVYMRAMIDASGAKRLGTPDDITAAVAIPPGPDSTFITGVDLLVNGGVIAALRSGQVTSADPPKQLEQRTPTSKPIVPSKEM